ncbi:LD-carboxypeptidase [Lujinxingia sediminis]|uniref:LD-carboxypeptidase n=1 Tax=Lujinxingia sediminis TaxID=2480984 RepID=A0ABY0CST6_9DELT|nr:LD-carboxypeptidase [Lujinxingia sediminis]
MAEPRRQLHSGPRHHKHPSGGRRGRFDPLQTRNRRVTSTFTETSALHLVHPAPLRPGDRVHVVSPAGPVIPQLLEEGLATLRAWGLDVVIDDAVYARRPGADYLAGDDEARAAAFLNAWRDPECRALFCSRGGFGSQRILPLLNELDVRAHPRHLVGFSDITALHLHLAGNLRLQTWHGPVVKSFALHRDDSHRSIEHLRALLFGEKKRDWRLEGLRTVRPGRAQGRLLGGNLCVLVHQLATDYCPSLDDAILVVEDVGEVDYRIDRLFTALRHSLKGQRIAGLVLGDFSDAAGVYVDDEGTDAFLAMLASEFDCPVVAGAPVGHRSPNLALPMGAPAELNADLGRLTLLT